MTLKTRPTLAICGTYTVDPVVDVIEYWSDFLNLGLVVRVAPYAQIFQQLLDPTSELHRNESGANAVLLRWTDLLPRCAHSPAVRVSWSELEGTVDEVASALQAFEHRVPCLVLVGPSDQQDPVSKHATSALESRLAGTPNLFVEQGEDAMRRYGVERICDPDSDRFGHVPFTSQAMTALGTTIARWHASIVRSPVKMVAVDGDNTLWSGVVAEDGADGVRIDAPHRCLQSALVEQHDAGRLVCVLSKNEEVDVRGVFEAHPEMPLGWSHFVARRIDWNPKPDNLRDILSGLGLGLDSAVFLDDNPMECAEMRARCPSVATVRVPTDPEQLASFADHFWLFDRPGTTAEDRTRTQMYHDNESRAELRRNADSLQTFLDGLELIVEIAPPTSAEVSRLAQLTQRTNQFNASLIRCDHHDVCQAAEDGQVFQRLVRARDRFGNYGIVGQVRARSEGNLLAVDLFMLSCRALGRGIEHRMIAAAGEYALALGLDEVAVLFRRGDRNAPVRRFLEKVFGALAQSDEQWFRLPARLLARVAFDASMTDGASGAPEDLQQPPVHGEADPLDSGARYEQIAHQLTTAARIEQAIARRVRPRSELGSGYIAPAPGLERDLAAIWQEVLRIDQVGSHDRFGDLGGKSIHLVRVHSLLLDRLKVEMDITTLFQHPTVASLAAHMAARTSESATDAARQRGQRMRDARARAGSTQHTGVPL